MPQYSQFVFVGQPWPVRNSVAPWQYYLSVIPASGQLIQ